MVLFTFATNLYIVSMLSSETSRIWSTLLPDVKGVQETCRINLVITLRQKFEDETRNAPSEVSENVSYVALQSSMYKTSMSSSTYTSLRCKHHWRAYLRAHSLQCYGKFFFFVLLDNSLPTNYFTCYFRTCHFHYLPFLPTLTYVFNYLTKQHPQSVVAVL